ncbi:basic helix-loop-helix transcription factor [Lithospermum erythrorhizon]|uniref:Basic helix-loop-helix transcription factor n=1 Tax=Lithospermum erythrorhizon TaxID=34254 RepID=A0AAV3P7F9_LITER
MDYSFDQINDLLEMFPDTNLYDNPFLQENYSLENDPLHLHFIPPQNSPSILPDQQPIHISQAPKLKDDNRPNKACKMKKISHRDTERQRRKEMACLYRNLRSLLPVERIKGKRSASDHIHETTGYIKQLQNRIENISNTRDRLNQQANSRSSSPRTVETQSCSFTSVKVRGSTVGMEVSINTASVGGVNLSRVLNVVNKEGYNIVACISAKVDGRLLHTIDIEVMQDMVRGRKSGTDPNELQEMLANYCNWWH